MEVPWFYVGFRDALPSGKAEQPRNWLMDLDPWSDDAGLLNPVFADEYILHDEHNIPVLPFSSSCGYDHNLPNPGCCPTCRKVILTPLGVVDVSYHCLCNLTLQERVRLYTNRHHNFPRSRADLGLRTFGDAKNEARRATAAAAAIDMESTAAPRPPSPHTLGADGMTLGGVQTPSHVPTLNHFQDSHLREKIATENEVPKIPTQLVGSGAPQQGPVEAIDTNQQPSYRDDDDDHDSADRRAHQQPAYPAIGLASDYPDLDERSAYPDPDEEGIYLSPDAETNMQAFAKLCLPDGDYYIKTLAVRVVRDMDYFESEMRRRQEQARARSSYESSAALDGRPEPGLPSSYSEQGGAIAYNSQFDYNAEATRRRRQRKTMKYLRSKSSESNSVAPANLHTYPGLEIPEEDIPLLPIHPMREEQEKITHISKNALLIAYNMDNVCWEMHILGRPVILNEEVKMRNDGEAGTPLKHGDRIVVGGCVELVFKLPDNARASPGISRGTFDDHTNDASSDLEPSDVDDNVMPSPAARRSSLATDGDDADEDVDDEDEDHVNDSRQNRRSRKKPRKLMGNKKRLMIQQNGERQPKVDSSKQLLKSTENAANDTCETPAQPLNLDGSILANMAPEQLPKKRSGPGRPPKNGLISKRDETAVKKRMRQYEQRGVEPPSFTQVLEQVRLENKQKDAAAKAAAKGQAPPPAGALPAPSFDGIQQSIEGDDEAGSGEIGSQIVNGQPNRSSAEPYQRATVATTSGISAARAFSPIPPKSSFTAAQLEKPAQTYVPMLYQILQEHPDGRADLQDIYHRMMKKWPYFKYGPEGHGWQSSVRHNLQQTKWFIKDEKSGKGYFWKINTEEPFEPDQKRRGVKASQSQQQPPMPATQSYHPVPQALPGGVGSSQGYFSPYGQGGAAPELPSTLPSGPGALQPPQQPRPAQQGDADPQQRIIQDIIAFQAQYLAHYPQYGPEWEQRNQFFIRVLKVWEPAFSSGDATRYVANAEEDWLWQQFDAIASRHGRPRGQPTPALAQPQTQPQLQPELPANPSHSNDHANGETAPAHLPISGVGEGHGVKRAAEDDAVYNTKRARGE